MIDYILEHVSKNLARCCEPIPAEKRDDITRVYARFSLGESKAEELAASVVTRSGSRRIKKTREDPHPMSPIYPRRVLISHGKVAKGETSTRTSESGR